MEWQEPIDLAASQEAQPVSPSIFKRLVIFFSRKKREQTYFIDWQIYDNQGNFFKWANSVRTTSESPHEVYAKCSKEIMEGLTGTGAARIRAVSFSKI